jgi:hypothetical protein
MGKCHISWPLATDCNTQIKCKFKRARAGFQRLRYPRLYCKIMYLCNIESLVIKAWCVRILWLKWISRRGGKQRLKYVTAVLALRGDEMGQHCITVS